MIFRAKKEKKSEREKDGSKKERRELSKPLGFLLGEAIICIDFSLQVSSSISLLAHHVIHK